MTSHPGQPLVSIVTPTLNQGAFIEETIQSIRDQTYPNIEHIVVDGGSSDETLNVLRRHEGTYRMRWSSGPDAGMYDAINKGLDAATGDIVAYLNSDDLYFPWSVGAAVAALERRPDVDFVYGDFVQINEVTGRSRVVWQMPFDLDYIQRTGFLAQPTVFWRRSAHVALGGFDTNLRYIADCDFWMRAGATHRFLKVDEMFAIDREQSRSLRQTDALALDNELTAVRSRYVHLQGDGHARMLRRHRVRVAMFRRWYGLLFTAQASIPARLRLASWRQFLAVPGVGASLPWAIISQIPRVGWRHADRAIQLPSAIGRPSESP